jgi:ribonuclease HI
LFLDENHYFKGKENLGSGTNNSSEFSALLLLFKCVVENHVNHLQILGDSKLVIQWMQERIHIENLGLLPLAS